MIRAIIFSCIALGIALIAMLFYASSNNAVFEQHYASLFWLGLALTIGLLILIVVQVVGLVKKLRGRVFGSTLALRLMAVFALMAVIPGGLVYVISVQFLNRSVDSWFDVPVDRAFESALNLGRAALEASGNELLRRSRDAALKAADSKSDATGIARQLRQQYGFDEVVIVDEDAKIKGWQGGGDPTQTNRTRLMPDKPTVAEVKDAISKGPQKFTETLGDRVIFFRVVILMPAAPSIEGTRTIQLMQSAPRILMKDAQTVDAGARDYQRLQLVFLATEEYPKIKPSDIEFKLPQPNYTVNTLAHLQEIYSQHSFSLIMGEDNLKSLHKWKNYEVILQNHAIYVYPRISSDEDNLTFKNNPNIHFIDAPIVEISSTFIRVNIKNKMYVRPLLPAKVWEYIDHNNLYKK